MTFSCNHLLVIGLGQLGSSVAMAARERGVARHIVGVDANVEAVQANLRMGRVDEVFFSVAELTEKADVAVVAVPVTLTAGYVVDLMVQDKAALITDTGSVKHGIVAGVQSKIATSNGASAFVPAHPLAGTEKSGFISADAQMFARKKLIITPAATHTGLNAEVATLFWQALGAEVIYMEPERHDMVYAVVSHLVQLVAYAYDTLVRSSGVAMPEEPVFRSFYRLHASSRAMWDGIFTLNYENILFALSVFESLMNSKDRVDLFNEMPLSIAAALHGTMRYFSEKLGFNLADYAAGGYRDITVPLAGWSINSPEVQVSTSQLLKYARKIISFDAQ